MLRKLNVTLLIIAIILGTIIGGYYVYSHFNSGIENNRIVQQLGGV